MANFVSTALFSLVVIVSSSGCEHKPRPRLFEAAALVKVRATALDKVFVTRQFKNFDVPKSYFMLFDMLSDAVPEPAQLRTPLVHFDLLFADGKEKRMELHGGCQGTTRFILDGNRFARVGSYHAAEDDMFYDEAAVFCNVITELWFEKSTGKHKPILDIVLARLRRVTGLPLTIVGRPLGKLNAHE